jgi:hypothetical protein
VYFGKIRRLAPIASVGRRELGNWWTGRSLTDQVRDNYVCRLPRFSRFLFRFRAGLSPLFSQDGQIFYFPAPISCLGEPGIDQLLVFRPESTSSSQRCSPSTHDAQAKFCASGRFRWFSVCQVVKTAQSRERTERTLLTRWFRLSTGTLVEQGDAADRRDPSLSHFRLRSPGSSCRQALMLFRRLAAHARVESAGARPSRAVLARRR